MDYVTEGELAPTGKSLTWLRSSYPFDVNVVQAGVTSPALATVTEPIHVGQPPGPGANHPVPFVWYKR
jgi:hypothetical protein